jgi:hypothetical protein
MAREQTSSTSAHFTPSFGKHEWTRILLPGFFFTVLLSIFATVFLRDVLQDHPGPILSVLMFGAFMIASGLTMYAKETPKRRRAFQENQPSQYLSAKARTMKGVELLEDDQARQLYFYILNNHMPTAFTEKIFLFGTIYHIMVQIRRMSFWFAVAGTMSILVRMSMGIPLPEQQTAVIFTVLVWFLYILNIRYNKADRKMQENYQDQILWLRMNNDLLEDILRRRQSAPTLTA